MNYGEIIGHYRIASPLGQGGMGIVYLAEDLSLGRKVALKVLSREFAGDGLAVERFRREARTASALNHPNICTIYEILEHEGQPLIAMELLDGQALKELLRERRLSIDEVFVLAIDVADALDAAHHAGVIHRDIKPGNIFVTTRGRAKLVDFGLAKMVSTGSALSALPTGTVDGHAEYDGLAETLTNTGITLGTVAYMSPEQARGDPLDARTDLFSFGIVLYEMATGLALFRGSSFAVVLHEILGKAPVPPLQLNPELPRDLDRLIMKALEKDRELRCQSAAEILSDLKRLKRDRDMNRPGAAVPEQILSRMSQPAMATTASPSGDQVTTGTVKRHRTAFGVGILTLTLFLVGMVYLATRSQPVPGAPPFAAVTQLTNSGKAK